MRKSVILGLSVIITFAIQLTLVNHIAIGGVKPDLLLILIVGIGFFSKKTFPWYLPASFSIGLIQDIFSFSPLGLNAVSKITVAYLIALFKRNVEVNNLIVQIASILIFTIIDISVFCLIGVIPFQMEINVGGIYLIEPLYNAVLAPLFFWGLGKI